MNKLPQKNDTKTVQIPMNKILQYQKNSMANQLLIFDKILERCIDKIKLAARINRTDCIYTVPGFIVGVPPFKQSECMNYLLEHLSREFITIPCDDNKIYINWDINFLEKYQKLRHASDSHLPSAT